MKPLNLSRSKTRTNVHRRKCYCFSKMTAQDWTLRLLDIQQYGRPWSSLCLFTHLSLSYSCRDTSNSQFFTKLWFTVESYNFIMFSNIVGLVLFTSLFISYIIYGICTKNTLSTIPMSSNWTPLHPQVWIRLPYILLKTWEEWITTFGEPPYPK